MKGLCIFFLQTLLIVFAGFVICNICAVVIKDVFDGFGLFMEQIADLPYVLYALFSLVISGLLTLRLRGGKG